MALTSALLYQILTAWGVGPKADLLKRLASEGSGGGGGGGGGVGYNAVLRPGAPSSGNAFATEAEVLAAIANIDAPVVGFDLQFVAGAYTLTMNWNMAGGTWVSTFQPTGSFTVTVPEGVQVTNLFLVRQGLGVRLMRTMTPGIIYAGLPLGAPRILSVGDGAVVENAGTFPGLPIVTGGVLQVVSVGVSSGIKITGGVALVRVAGLGAAAGTAGLVNLVSSRSIGQGVADGWLDSAAPGEGKVTYIAVDASFIVPLIPGFSGLPEAFPATNPNYIDLAQSMSYDDTLVAPPFFPLIVPPDTVTVQMMLDALKSRGSTLPFGAQSVSGPDVTVVSPLVLVPGFYVGPALVALPPFQIGGVRIAHKQILTGLRVSHVGNVANTAGATVMYELLVNGVIVAATTPVTAAAGIHSASEAVPFSVTLMPGDLLQVWMIQAGFTLGDPGVTDMLAGAG